MDKLGRFGQTGSQVRLHGVFEGRIYATVNRSLLVETGPGSETFERVGRLPMPGLSAKRLRRWLVVSRLRPAVERLLGAVTAVNVWPVSPTDLVATVGDRLYTSHDGGCRWERRHHLPPSSGPMGVLPTAVCRDGDRLLLGEYPLATDTTPRVLQSFDAGRTWETVVSLPSVRHVHAVQRDPYTGDVWLTTGDTDAESRIGRLRDGQFHPIGQGSQRWRAVELAFTPDAIIWGMDCIYAERKEILVLPRDDIDDGHPEPRSVFATEGEVYYAKTVRGAGGTSGPDGADYVVLSTSVGSTADSTAPDEGVRGEAIAQVVAASSATEYEEWVELARFRKRQVLADTMPLAGNLPTANAYVFLAADPDRGVFINPYNVQSADHSIYRISPETLTQRGAGRSSPDRQ